MWIRPTTSVRGEKRYTVELQDITINFCYKKFECLLFDCNEM